METGFTQAPPLLPADADFVALDFETANRDAASVCAVGLAFVSGGRVTANPAWLVRPPRLYFDPEFVKIHGITAAAVQDAPELGSLWAELAPLLENRIIIAHNAAFDITALINSLKKYSLPHPNLRYACTKVIAQKTWPAWKRYGLAPLAERHGIVFCHHNAAEDASVCAQIALSALKAKAAASFDELAVKLDFAYGRLYPGGHQPFAAFNKTVPVPAFGRWTGDIHARSGQLPRQERGRQLIGALIDRAGGCGRINGYDVTLDSCTCADFTARSLPCKHIYHLFFELEKPPG